MFGVLQTAFDAVTNMGEITMDKLTKERYREYLTKNIEALDELCNYADRLDQQANMILLRDHFEFMKELYRLDNEKENINY